MNFGLFLAPAKLLHDATTGFHDIKALPEFHPFPFHYIYYAIAALAVITITTWLFKKQSIDHKMAEPPKSAFVLAIEEIESIEQDRKNGHANLRDIGTRTSLTLRNYFTTELDFPANDQTTREVLRLLKQELKKNFRLSTESKIEDINKDISQTLTELERITFAGDSVARLTPDSPTIANLLQKSREIIGKLHTLAEEQHQIAPQIVEERGADAI